MAGSGATSGAPAEPQGGMAGATGGGMGGLDAGGGVGGVPASEGGAGVSTSGGGEMAEGGNSGVGGVTGGGGDQPMSGAAGSGQIGTGVDLDGPFILGADVSSVQEAMDQGASFVDTDGQTKSIFDVLKAHGFNAIRLRTFVNPGATYGYSSCGGGGVYADTAHTVEFGRQVKEAGMRLLLDLHYSDTWADPDKQMIPEAWRGASTIDELASYVYDYTEGVINAMISGGARPDFVQVGNEITPGMLIHTPTAQTDCYGNNGEVNPNGVTGQATTSNWSNLGMLLSAGIDAIKAVDEDIVIMLHIENKADQDVEEVISWVQSAISSGVSFDVLGLSCYTKWHGSPSVWRSKFDAVAAQFPDLSFVVAEYNPERTQANQIMLDLPDGRGLGTFFWEPTESGEWGQSMFTLQGNAYRANASDFSEYDSLRTTLGL